VAVLGTSISPYLFFWQSAHRIEELRAEDLAGDDAPALHRRGATAATLGVEGKTITSAAEAAQALEPIAGSASGYLFAAGFIGSGILAVPVLAASGSAGLAGLLDKPWGLDRSPRRAPVFYALLLVGMVGGTALSVVEPNPIGLLVLSAVVNGIAAGPFLIVVMLISRDGRLMGRYRNSRLAATLGWTSAGHTLSMASPRARGPGSTWENTDVRTNSCHHRSERRDRGRSGARADPHR
jgi:MFS family permease